jgi:hypothetical protein
MKTAYLTRKKPIQSRSQITLNSLQEAFVRVLIDRGYEKMTIREVVSVAGVTCQIYDHWLLQQSINDAQNLLHP